MEKRRLISSGLAPGIFSRAQIKYLAAHCALSLGAAARRRDMGKRGDKTSFHAVCIFRRKRVYDQHFFAFNQAQRDCETQNAVCSVCSCSLNKFRSRDRESSKRFNGDCSKRSSFSLLGNRFSAFYKRILGSFVAKLILKNTNDGWTENEKSAVCKKFLWSIQVQAHTN